MGYEEPSHFSREYRKFFGEPPKRDIERLQRLTTKEEGKGKKKDWRGGRGLVGAGLARSRPSR